jgi:beta-glucosidase
MFGSQSSFAVALMASLGLVDATTAAQNQVVNGTIIDPAYFYGQSPAVYPASAGNGKGGWEASYSKAAAMVAQMTIYEKVCCGSAKLAS